MLLVTFVRRLIRYPIFFAVIRDMYMYKTQFAFHGRRLKRDYEEKVSYRVFERIAYPGVLFREKNEFNNWEARGKNYFYWLISSANP